MPYTYVSIMHTVLCQRITMQGLFMPRVKKAGLLLKALDDLFNYYTITILMIKLFCISIKLFLEIGLLGTRQRKSRPEVNSR